MRRKSVLLASLFFSVIFCYAVEDQRNIYAIDINNLTEALSFAPLENSGLGSKVLISLPNPEGKLVDFVAIEYFVLPENIRNQFPSIKTYLLQGVDKAYLKGRITVGQNHLSGIFFSDKGQYYIENSSSQSSFYIYYAHQAPNENLESCAVQENDEMLNPNGHHTEISHDNNPEQAVIYSNAGSLRTFRLALSTTGEYFTNFGNNTTAVNTKLASIVNALNAIYENDLSIRFVIIPGNNALLFSNPSTDPYNPSSGNLPFEAFNGISNTISSNDYDIGHVLHHIPSGGSGIAYLGVVCDVLKAGGWSGNSTTLPFNQGIGLMGHEIAHQFNATHTYFGNAVACINREATTAYEPGSGTTIMGYPGVCGTQNVGGLAGDLYFHTNSLQRILDYVNVTATCANITTVANSAPVSMAGTGGYFIPKSTPFSLTGSATDANGDALTYCWEQYDTNPVSSGGAPSTGASQLDWPIFRSFLPTTSATRVFPQWSDILNNTTTIGENLSTVSRTLKFRLTVRDNNPLGGGVSTELRTIQVDGGSGPFQVTSPNTSVVWQAGSTQNITWNVNGTSTGNVSCANVAIDISTDGGFNYTTIVASTANDGSENIVVPALQSSTCRLRVRCDDNRFFDVSNANFRIETPFTLTIDSLKKVCEPSSAVFVVNVNQFMSSTTPVTLSVTGLPTGMSASFSVNPVVPGNNTTLTITSTNANGGLHDLVLTGSNGTALLDQVKSFKVEVLSSGTPVSTMPSVCSNSVSTIDLYTLINGESPQGTWTETSGVLSSPGGFDVNAGTFNPNGQAANTYSFKFSPKSSYPGLPLLNCNSVTSSIIGNFNGVQAAAALVQPLACNPGGRTGSRTYNISINVSQYLNLSGGQATANNMLVYILNSSGSVVLISDFNKPGAGVYSYTQSSSAALGSHDPTQGFTVWVTDFNNNANIAFTANLTITYPAEPLFTCPTNQSSVSVAVSNCSTTLNIEGETRTPNNNIVDGVIYNLVTSGGANQSVTAGAVGTYSFAVANGSNNSITANKNTDITPQRGVTVTDISLITAHILNPLSTPLNTPHKLRAADVTGNNSITALDIVNINALILGNTPTFNGGRLFDFVVSDYVFPTPTAPWSPITSRVVNSIASNQVGVNFTAVKLGDVNLSWVSGAGPKPKYKDILPVHMKPQYMGYNEVILPVEVYNFNGLLGYQFTIDWNPSELEFIGVNNGALVNEFGYNYSSTGNLTVLWSAINNHALSLQDGAVLMELRFRKLVTKNAMSPVIISSSITDMEVLQEGYEYLNISQTGGEVDLNLTTAVENVNNNYMLNQNTPNPFAQSTQLNFELPKAMKVSFEIVNTLGQVVQKEELSAQGGSNAYLIKTNLPAGQYFCKMIAEQFTQTIAIQIKPGL